MKKPINDFSYASSELDAVAYATNYYDWILDSFAPFLGRRIIEAGAGIGTVSEMILSRADPRALLLVEPAANNAAILDTRFRADSRVRVVHGYLEEIEHSWKADTIVAVNVMEHIRDDGEFLRAAHSLLEPDGSLLLLVPAVPAIYGSLDRAFEHYRRYTRRGLTALLEEHRFKIAQIRYMNALGVLAWMVSGKILRRKTLGRRQVQLYDRAIIPLLRRVESIIRPPIGQSLLVVARK